MAEKLLEVKDLLTCFHTSDGIVRAVDGMNLDVDYREILAIVGESGCGKSVTSLSITGLLSFPGKIDEGEIIFKGVDITKLSKKEMRAIRGKEISMIFQEPMTSLNPVITVGEQIAEVFRLHEKLNRQQAKEKTLEIIKEVGIPQAEVVFSNYPHQLSGGMRQRIMIAIALACNPDLLIADEPTTALDVTIQAQILELIAELLRKKEKGMILITHDLGVVAETADKVIVMYAGKAVEQADVKSLFAEPAHPYTQGLLASLPDMSSDKDTLYSIPGMVPNLLNLPQGCAFSPRCPIADKHCREVKPEYISYKPGHMVRCHKAGERGIFI